MVAEYFASSWRLADKAFAPDDLFLGEQDETIRSLYRWRSIIGGVIILCAAVRYDQFSGIPQAFSGIYQSVNWTIGFAFFAVLPAGLAVVLYTRPDSRKSAIRQLRYPAMAFGGVPLTYCALLLSHFLLYLTGVLGILGLPLAIALMIAMAWAVAFLVRMAYLLGTGLFRLGDGHPLLPPVVTVLAAWCLAIKGLLAGGSGNSEPAAIVLVLLLGGPASLTALAILEIKRLKDRYRADFPFRHGPLAGSQGSGPGSMGYVARRPRRT